MVSSPSTIEIIAKTLQKYPLPPLVIDPVMISKSGYDLLKPEAKTALIEKLLPLAKSHLPHECWREIYCRDPPLPKLL